MSIVQNKVFASEIALLYEGVISSLKKNNHALKQIIQRSQQEKKGSYQMDKILNDLLESNKIYEEKIIGWYKAYLKLEKRKSLFFRNKKNTLRDRILKAQEYFSKQDRQLAITKSAIAH